MPTADEPKRNGVNDVRADNATAVENNDGNVNSGSGDQINQNFLGIDPHKLLRRIPKVELADVRLRWLAARFVEPANFSKARSRLAGSRAVLVEGAPGTGRRSTAKMLLSEFAGRSAPVREISVDTDDETDLLNPESVHDHDRLLVDLSEHAELKTLESVLARLDSFCDQVRKLDGYVAVVLPAGEDYRLQLELSPQLVKIKRPSGADVLLRHLEAEGIAVPPGALEGKARANYLAVASMDEIGRLCQLIRSEREDNEQRGFAACWERAFQQVSKRNKAIAKLVSGATADDRAWLVAAGVLEGAHVDAVGEAAEKLLVEAGGARVEGSALGGTGLEERLQKLNLAVTEKREIQFDEHSAEAVLNHFWNNFPGLRPVLLEWVGTCLTSELLTDGDRTALVQRFATLCRRSRHGADLCSLADWLLRLDVRRQPPRVGMWAARILAEGLQEEPGARAIRRKIHNWVSGPSLSVELAKVLVLVCSEVLTQTHPEQAMVRLRYLAGHTDAWVVSVATKTLLQLVAEDRIFLELLWRLASAARRSKADARLFLQIMTPQRLLRDSAVFRFGGVPDQLTTGWTHIVERPREFWAEHAREWFSAFADDASAEPLLDVLVAAAVTVDRQGRLYVVLRDWGCGDPDSVSRQRTVQLVRDKIDSAQLARPGTEKEMAR